MSSTLNRLFKVVWCPLRGCCVAVSELAKGRIRSTSSRVAAKVLLATAQFVARHTALVGALLGAYAPLANAQVALPQGAIVRAGDVHITQPQASALQVQQSSNQAIVDWRSFSIGQGGSVSFVQPSASSMILNRVIGNERSVIDGALNANGQVWLLNSQGVLIGKSGTVNTHGFLATTRDISNADFLGKQFRFSGQGQSGSIDVLGQIEVGPNGYALLSAPTVNQAGSVVANLGTVGLAGGNLLALDLQGDKLISYSLGNASQAAVNHTGYTQADGGQVLMSASSVNQLQSAVVNVGGLVRANTVAMQEGRIVLGAGPQGQLNVTGQVRAEGVNSGERGGYIDASGHAITVNSGASFSATGHAGGGSVYVGLMKPNPDRTTIDGNTLPMTDTLHLRSGSTLAAAATGGGAGGFVETSAQRLQIDDGAVVTTTASSGQHGQWLIDPADFTIAASAGNLTGTALSAALQSNNVTIQTLLNSSACTGVTCGPSTSTGNGDIFVNDGVSWSSATTLTLSAYRNVNINADVSASNSAGKLALEIGQGTTNGAGSDYYIAAGNRVRLQAGNNFSVKLGSSGGAQGYTVITSLGAQGSLTTNDLQGIQGNLSGRYALGDDINASATSSWNSGAGFSPIASNNQRFTGTFTGLGNRVSNLTINLPNQDRVAFIGESSGVVRNVGMESINVTGRAIAAGLVGYLPGGKVLYSYSTGLVTSTRVQAGGLVGAADAGSLISNSYSLANVVATQPISENVGGLVGELFQGSIQNSYARGSVSGVIKVGGLVGQTTGGTITNSYSIGTVTGTSAVGGLIGNKVTSNPTTVTASFWDTQTSGLNIGVGQGGSTGVTGQTTANMKLVSTFQNAGWNISAVDGAYPLLSFKGSPVWGDAVIVAPPPPALTTVYVRLACDPCQSTYGNTPIFGFKAYSAATGGSELTDAQLTGTALYSLTSGVSAAGSVLDRLTDAGTYSITYTSGLTTGNATYTLAAGSGISFTVQPRGLTVTLQSSVLSPLSKVYDASNTLALSTSNFVLGNFVDQQGTGASVNLTSGLLNSKDVASATTVTASLSAGNLVTANGVNASNYTLPAQVSASASVTAKALTIGTGSIADKVYDGQLATGTVTPGTLSGFATGESNLAFNSVTGTFATKDVARDSSGNVIAKHATVAYVLADGVNGEKASNYSLANTTATGKITPKALSISAASIADKVYDGQLASGAVTPGTLSGFVTGESNLTFEAVTGSFATKDVARDSSGNVIAKQATVAYALADGANGEKAGNYSLANTTATGKIIPKALSISAASIADKVYDGQLASGTVTPGTLSGFVSGESNLTFEAVTGTFATKDVARDSSGNVIAKQATVAYALADGANGEKAGNYSLANTTETGKVTPRPLEVVMQVADKVYDGTDVAQVQAFLLRAPGATLSIGNGVLANEQVSVTGQARFDNANVALNSMTGAVQLKLVTAQGATLTGSDAMNYMVVNNVISSFAKISPKTVTADITALNKRFDGNNRAELSSRILQGLVAGDQVSLVGNAIFDSDQPGVNRAVTLQNPQLEGAQANNYALNPNALIQTTANIESETAALTQISSIKVPVVLSASASAVPVAPSVPFTVQAPTTVAPAVSASTTTSATPTSEPIQAAALSPSVAGGAEVTTAAAAATSTPPSSTSSAASSPSAGKGAAAASSGAASAKAAASSSIASAASAKGASSAANASGSKGSAGATSGGKGSVGGAGSNNSAAGRSDSLASSDCSKQPSGGSNGAAVGCQPASALTLFKPMSKTELAKSCVALGMCDPPLTDKKAASAAAAKEAMRAAAQAAHDVMADSFDQVPTKGNSGVANSGKSKQMLQTEQQLGDTILFNTLMMFF